MNYKYETIRSNIFTDEGQRVFLKIRDRVNELVENSGCFAMGYILGLHADDWMCMACVDRMVELDELQELVGGRAGQNRIFVSRVGK